MIQCRMVIRSSVRQQTAACTGRLQNLLEDLHKEDRHIVFSDFPPIITGSASALLDQRQRITASRWTLSLALQHWFPQVNIIRRGGLSDSYHYTGRIVNASTFASLAFLVYDHSETEL